MFFSDIKKETNQTTDEPNNPILPPNKSVTILCNYLYIILLINHIINFFNNEFKLYNYSQKVQKRKPNKIKTK